MLEHGQSKHAAEYLPQVEQASVVSRCPCGCVSIDLAIGGIAPRGGGLDILADFGWSGSGGEVTGAFVFAKGGRLAGLDVHSVDGRRTPDWLPDLSALTPAARAAAAQQDASTNRPKSA